MSEQEKPKSFMEELDSWTVANVINPLHEVVMEGDIAACDATREEVKKAIRTKVSVAAEKGTIPAGETEPLVRLRSELFERLRGD